MTPTTLDRTAPVNLVRLDPAHWQADDGRFTIVRTGATRTTPITYDVTDTTRTDWVDRPGQGNVVRVFELADARAVIAKAIRRTPRHGRSTT